MVQCTRGPGLRTKNMEKGEKYMLVGICMRGTSSMVNFKGKVDHGLISIHLGVYNWSDGDRYTGDFNDGVRHGQGLFKWYNLYIYIYIY